MKPWTRPLVVNLENSKRTRNAFDCSGSPEVCNHACDYNQAWVEFGQRFYDIKTINRQLTVHGTINEEGCTSFDYRYQKSLERLGYISKPSAVFVKNGEGCTSCMARMPLAEVTSMLTRNSSLFDGDSGSLVGYASHFTAGRRLPRRQGLQRTFTAYPWYVKNARGCTLFNHDGLNFFTTVGDGTEGGHGSCDVFSSCSIPFLWRAKMARGCTLYSNDGLSAIATVGIDRTKNSYSHCDVVSSGSPFYYNKPLLQKTLCLSTTRCQLHETNGDTVDHQNRSARRQIGWGEGHHYSGLLVCFRCFLLLHQATIAALALLQLITFVIQRILFLNYEGQKDICVADFGWQCARVGCILIFCIGRALTCQRRRPRQLIIAGKQRLQRVRRRCPNFRWTAIWMCVMVTTAHAIELHNEISGTSHELHTQKEEPIVGRDPWSMDQEAQVYNLPASNDYRQQKPTFEPADALSKLVGATDDEIEDAVFDLVSLQPTTVLSDRVCTLRDGDPHPPMLQWRPNPQLQQPFDEAVPDIRHGPTGPQIVGTIIPPPNWESTAIFRAAVTSRACRRGPDGHLVLHIRSWYIAHNGVCVHQPRDFAMRPQLLVRLTHALRRTWRDHLLGHETITIRPVRPPPVDADATRRFHIIAEINRPIRTDFNPILIAIREITSGGVSVPLWCTALLSTQMTSIDLFDACQPTCSFHQFLIPIGGNVRRWLTPYNVRVISPGLFIPCWYDRRLQPIPQPTYETEDDHTDLMQRSLAWEIGTPQQTPSSTVSSSGTVLVHVFRMSAEHRLIVLDPGSQTTYFNQLSEAWRAQKHDHLLDYHVVASPPRDLTNTGDSVFVLEWSTDRNRQAVHDDQLILLDITLREADHNMDPHVIRRVIWMRHTTTRQGVLHLTSSATICDRQGIECQIHLNHRLWTQDDAMPRATAHGDYVSLQIRCTQSTTTVELQGELCEQESADSQRYLFQPSPQRSPTSHSNEEEGSESDGTNGTERTVRSRSPRGLDDGQEEGNVLLQLTASKKTLVLGSRALSEIGPRSALAFAHVLVVNTWPDESAIQSTLTSSYNPIGSWSHKNVPRRLQPHVIDRWCVVDARDVTCANHDTLDFTRWKPEVTHWFPLHPAEGCSHENVRRPHGLLDASLGGSYDGDYALTLYTRSHHDISRQWFWFSGIPPLWDVDAIFDRLCLPGNPTQSFYIGDDCQEGVDNRDEDQYQIIDVRKNLHMELLDVFHISGMHIVISEVLDSKPVFVTMGPSGVDDTALNSLLTPWPQDVVTDRFDKIPEIHHFLDNRSITKKVTHQLSITKKKGLEQTQVSRP